MATDSGNRPCPYCAELIKANALKCRFCGEFLDQVVTTEARMTGVAAEADEATSGAVKQMIVPIGRSGWAIASGWLAIVALVPFPIFVFTVLGEQGRNQLTTNLMYLAAGINVMFALLAMITAIGAFLSPKKGKVRAIFGVTGGVVAALGYPLMVYFWPQLVLYLMKP